MMSIETQPKNHAVRILPFEQRWQEEIGQMVISIQRDEFHVPITLEEQPDLLKIAEFYGKGKSNFWVALHGDRVVGSIGLIDIGNEQAAIRKMFVAAEFRGKEKGVARELFANVVEYCKVHGIKQIFLGTVEALKAAQRFYLKNNFVEIPADALPDSFPRMEIDTRFFRLDVR